MVEETSLPIVTKFANNHSSKETEIVQRSLFLTTFANISKSYPHLVLHLVRCAKKSNPTPLRGHRLPVTTLLLLDNHYCNLICGTIKWLTLQL